MVVYSATEFTMGILSLYCCHCYCYTVAPLLQILSPDANTSFEGPAGYLRYSEVYAGQTPEWWRQQQQADYNNNILHAAVRDVADMKATYLATINHKNYVSDVKAPHGIAFR